MNRLTKMRIYPNDFNREEPYVAPLPAVALLRQVDATDTAGHSLWRRTRMGAWRVEKGS